ncbi:MAG: glycosyltransferase [Prevotellaceae bacterium]|jgi:glycosyltransferase involved in cell wall biosynthesis|nr:glycosyltransferase [Prevotellaceae bacterium]
MNNPKISVIIPVYNGEKYAAQCIENVLFQTYKNLEIIVVNDGSTDSSLDVIQKFKNLKIINQENLGLSAARNIGIKAASGDYIHFFDVDDLINADFYEKMLDAILFADADAACCSVIHEKHPQQTTIFSERIIAVNPDDKLSLCKVWTQGYVWKYLFRRSFLLENNLQFEHGRFIEDMAYSMQAVFWANRVIVVPHAVYFYKYRQNSILNAKSKKMGKKRRRDYKYFKQFCMDFAQKNGLQSIQNDYAVWTQYKLFGIPIIKKQVLGNGRTRWYLFGCKVLRKKII